MIKVRVRRFLRQRLCFFSQMYVKRALATMVLAICMTMLASCGSGSGTSAPPVSAPGALQITLSPSLSRAFDPNISDYAFVYKSGSPVTVTVSAPNDTTVSVEGQAVRGQTFTTQVSVTPGQGFSLVVNSAGGAKTYFVRCLPTDFPLWSTERIGTPQAEYYIVAPSSSFSPGTPNNYVIIADSYGVPLWWYHSSALPLDAKLLSNGNVAWSASPLAEEHKLDGTLVHAFTGAGLTGGTLDNHELLLLPNGNYLFIVDVPRTPVDLSSFGGSATATVTDTVLNEVTPTGSVVWNWSSFDHIPVSEVDPVWRGIMLANASPADPYHMNSAEPEGNGYILSFRHLNAIMKIDKASGEIVWKLGGTPRSESLTFAGDPYSNFGGQHDARILSDGSLTLQDNGSPSGRRPRAVRYHLDLTAKRATLVEQVSDPEVESSLCCGSARKLGEGNWVMSWGGNSSVTELTPAGTRVFRMTFPQNLFSYRAAPVPAGMLTREALRQGMDAQFRH